MSKTLKHYANPTFWEKYKELPENIKKLANRNFELLKKNPYHPSLHLKKVGRYWSVRGGKKYRAIGIEIGEGII